VPSAPILDPVQPDSPRRKLTAAVYCPHFESNVLYAHHSNLSPGPSPKRRGEQDVQAFFPLPSQGRGAGG
jgi:hypothetical protein